MGELVVKGEGVRFHLSFVSLRHKVGYYPDGNQTKHELITQVTSVLSLAERHEVGRGEGRGDRFRGVS